MRADRSFRVMGTTANVCVIDGDPAVARSAQRLLEGLHTRWSRFIPDSDVSRLNRADGSAIAVGVDTITLVETATTAWVATDGAFDPTVHDAIFAAGYDRTFEALPTNGVSSGPPPFPCPGCSGIQIDRDAGTIRLPAGVRIDAGGIGKGLAADLVIDRLAHRAAGLCIDVGGDLRVTGLAPDPGGWRIGLDPAPAVLSLRDGAVATSSTLHRRWNVGGRTRHHLVEPRTGCVATTAIAAVTVVAGQAWWAEAMATAALLGPDVDQARRALEGRVEGALLITGTGDITVIGSLQGGHPWTVTPGGTSPGPVASSPGR